MVPHSHQHPRNANDRTEKKWSIVAYIIILAVCVFVFALNYLAPDEGHIKWFKANHHLEVQRSAMKTAIESLHTINQAIENGWHPKGKSFDEEIELLHLIQALEQHLFLASGSRMSVSSQNSRSTNGLRSQPHQDQHPTGGDKIVQLMNGAIQSSVPRLMKLKVDLLALPAREIQKHPKASVLAAALVQADLDIVDVTRMVEETAARYAKEQYTNVLPRLPRLPRNETLPTASSSTSSPSPLLPLKLQIGAAGDSSLLDHWINIDVVGGRAPRTKDAQRPIELAMNVATTPLPFEANTCSTVYMAHVLEHLQFPSETFYLLNELFRVLLVGGTVRIVVPDSTKWMNAYLQDSTGSRSNFWKAARKEWTDWNWDDEPTLPLVLSYMGALDTSWENPNPHRVGFDAELLTDVLQQVGFQHIVVSTYMGSKHPELLIDDTSEAASTFWMDDESEGKGESERERKKYFSLFVEATK